MFRLDPILVPHPSRGNGGPQRPPLRHGAGKSSRISGGRKVLHPGEEDRNLGFCRGERLG